LPQPYLLRLISRTNSEKTHETPYHLHRVLGLTFTSAAKAKGCIKGAIVGGIAGHMAGQGKVDVGDFNE
jgi:hypothetical protein